ncbi:hypothetical protein PAXINDRAFT_20726 [Paxillus involutus ATCC 200175]|uniref:Secreted protein n=1 Tax=Paxillus involutus ATCC 200175 TaxID=664439 RepID=A0A0C9SUE9_PAXIN|nr:hypothetical protein PAXINDRAFT_20726 [Paxillus involutus ATCC 200175]
MLICPLSVILLIVAFVAAATAAPLNENELFPTGTGSLVRSSAGPPSPLLLPLPPTPPHSPPSVGDILDSILDNIEEFPPWDAADIIDSLISGL